MPVRIQLGSSATVGRSSGHGVDQLPNANQVSGKQCHLSLDELGARLTVEVVGRGRMRVVRASGEAPIMGLKSDQLTSLELQPFDRVELQAVRDEEPRPIYTLAAWHVPAREAWPTPDPHPPAQQLAAEETKPPPTGDDAEDNKPPRACVGTTPLTAQSPRCKRVAVTPLSGAEGLRERPSQPAEMEQEEKEGEGEGGGGDAAAAAAAATTTTTITTRTVRPGRSLRMRFRVHHKPHNASLSRRRCRRSRCHKQRRRRRTLSRSCSRS